jgi:hypothetical protein
MSAILILSWIALVAFSYLGAMVILKLTDCL